MQTLHKLTEKINKGEMISREEALALYEVPLKELCHAANEMRKKHCGDNFDLCSIINGKSGRCSENCKYCAQSVHYHTKVEEYPLLGEKEIIELAKYNESKGILRYSIVTSGKQLTDDEVGELCKIYKKLREKSGIALCASHGLLTYEQFIMLKESGVTRYHNNLETSRRFFPEICTTHTFEDKVKTIQAAMKAGLTVCSGGILGLGETREDRVDMVLSARELGVKSIPVNLLNPIHGTPFEGNERITDKEVLRTVAIFRFLIPDGAIRLAGGRGLLEDKGKAAFYAGVNAVISGDMLTTSGITIETDVSMVNKLGYQVKQI